MALIFKELSEGRPIFYSGNSPDVGGHAFVLDGYDATGKVHINWGWRGTDNDYYDIDLLEGENNFCDNQSMVIGIIPPSKDINTGIDTDSSALTVVAIYNIHGVQVEALQPGVNIVKYSDGTTTKVMQR